MSDEAEKIAALAAAVTNEPYRLIMEAQKLMGPCPENGRFPPAPQHPCPPPQDVWIAEASAMIDKLCLELRKCAYWVPQVVTEDRYEAYRKWLDQQELV